MIMTIENQLSKEQPTTNSSASEYYNTYEQFPTNANNNVAAIAASNAASAAASRSVPGSRRNSNDEKR